jgi:hypothetical protein
MIGASVGLVGRRWPAMLLILAIYWALDTASRLTPIPNYPRGHFDQLALLQYVGWWLAWCAIICLRDGSIVATAVQSSRLNIMEAVTSTAKASPTLLAYYIVVSLPALAMNVWKLLVPWPQGAMAMAPVFAIASLALFILDGAITAAFGLIVPIAVAERCGPIAALRRSWWLLSGSRWRLVALWAGLQILRGLIFFVFPQVHLASAGPRHAIAVAGIVVSLVVAAYLTVTAVAYQQLARGRVGLPEQAISDIFA